MDDKEKLNAIQEFMSKVETASDKTKDLAKIFTLSSFGIIVIIGVLGSFNFFNFNMDNYVKFLDYFLWFFIPLVASIGVNSGLKKFNKNGSEK